MRILLANKYYYPRGGDCICTIELEKLLKQQGHEVAVFSMQHPDNIPTEWGKYFPEEVDFSKSGKKNIFNFISRPLGASDVKQKFTQLLDDFNPDIVHLHNIHTQISPIIAKIASKRGVKVVWTLHDYKLLCPRYDCLRNGKQVCELCFDDKKNVLKYSCLKNNISASLLAYLEAVKWNRAVLEKYTHTFICPSHFMREKMIRGGFQEEKLNVLCNFINKEKVRTTKFMPRENYYCYLGRISEEKGLETLLQAAGKLPYPLKIIGDGPLLVELKEKYPLDNVEFLGYRHWDSIKSIVSSARFIVIPSEWYENNPLSILEAQCLGTPILGADIGGIPELIGKENGMLFRVADVIELQEKITFFFNDHTHYNYEKIATESQSRYSSENYYDQLMKIYQSS